MKDLMIVLDNGFEEIEALTVSDYLRRADISVDLVSAKKEREVESSHGVKVVADYTVDEIKINDYNGIYIPGGQPGATNLSKNKKIRDIIELYNDMDKYVIAICAGPMVLDSAGVLKNKKFTCYPGVEERLENKNRLDEVVVQDNNVITSMGPSLAQVLAFKLIEEFKGKEVDEKIKKDVLFDRLVEEIKK